MAIEIPLDTSDLQPRFDFAIDLDGAEYLVGMDWCERAARWLFSLVTADGQYVVRHARVLPNALPLTLVHHRPGCPTGELVFLSTADAIPGLGDLGSVTRLYYFSADEL